jgi:dGTP triphosphohydrolase
LIVGLIAVGLTSALVASFSDVRPEITVETCSFMVALLLVFIERRSSAAEERRTAIDRVAEELRDCARALTGEIWTESSAAILAAAKNKRDGLRIYYPHLSVSAVTAGLLGKALGSKSDAAMAKRLQQWRAAAEQCNARFAMAELLLFFLPPSKEAMAERLRLHTSIAAGPVAKRRKELRDLIDFLSSMTQGRLSRTASTCLDDARDALGSSAKCEATTLELQESI